MIDVMNKTCIYEECKTMACYNIFGEKKELFCSKHKLDGMVDIKSKKCIHDGCKIRPTFNNNGEITALYCSNHKLDRMVDIKVKNILMMDVKNNQDLIKNMKH